MINNEKITLAWLRDHVPLKGWLAIMGIIGFVFVSGGTFSQWTPIGLWFENLNSEQLKNKQIEELNAEPFQHTDKDVEKLTQLKTDKIQELSIENKKLRVEIDSLKRITQNKIKAPEVNVSNTTKEITSAFSDKLVGSWRGSHTSNDFVTSTEYFYYMTFTPDYRISATWIDDKLIDCMFTEKKQVLSITCPDKRKYKITILLDISTEITALYQNISRKFTKDT